MVDVRTEIEIERPAEPGAPSGFSKVAAPVMAAAMRRANQKDLARLKRLLEDNT